MEAMSDIKQVDVEHIEASPQMSLTLQPSPMVRHFLCFKLTE